MKLPTAKSTTRAAHDAREADMASEAHTPRRVHTPRDASATGKASASGEADANGNTSATGNRSADANVSANNRASANDKASADDKASVKMSVSNVEATPSGSTLPLIIGHRGASASAPENTIAAFERALRDGADGIEFDVRLARDGVPVIIHDATLRRTAGIDAPVAALSSTDLSATDVGSWFNRRHPARAAELYARETVPTLARVFEIVAPRCRLLYVELKCEAGETASLVERVVAEVRAHRLERRVLIESFTLAAIAEAKRIAPDVRTAAAFERRPGRPILTARSLLKRARDCRADELALARTLVSRRTVAAARAHGLQTVVWTVDHPTWFRRACALGLRAVITNDPSKMCAAREEFLEQQRLR
ncbi:MAG TPA: glycerophosphodiester phosphodiesterase family protein [Pyrinomonadaceae bacterium]